MIDGICRVRDGVEIAALQLGIWERGDLKVAIVGIGVEEGHRLGRRGVRDIGDRSADDVKGRHPTADVDEWLPCGIHRMLWQRVDSRVEDVIVWQKLIATLSLLRSHRCGGRVQAASTDASGAGWASPRA